MNAVSAFLSSLSDDSCFLYGLLGVLIEMPPGEGGGCTLVNGLDGPPAICRGSIVLELLKAYLVLPVVVKACLETLPGDSRYVS